VPPFFWGSEKAMIFLIVILGILVFGALGIGGWAVGAYNALIALNNTLDQAWANIDVLLKQRRDELTKLIDTVKGVKDFEQGTLMALTQARSHAASAQGTASAVAAAGAESSALRGFFAVAEAYPQLQADKNFQELQERISAIETSIADRREVFNDAVNNYNTRIAQFPDSIFAGFLRYQRHEYYKVEEADKADLKVQF
jgi:LemA protein